MGFWHPVVEFLGAIVGVDPDDWPGGDEDALREYARQYDAIAKELRTTVATGCREGSTAVAAAWNGEAGRALSAQILAYGTDKDFGGVETIAGAAEELAQYLRDQADTIVRAKVMIIAQIAVGVLMFAIPAGKALSLGMRAAFRQALKDFIHNRARGVMKQALSALAARAGKALAMTPVKFFRGAAIAGVGAGVYGLAPNTIAQGYGVLTGQSGRTTPDGHHADGWNWDETKQYAAIAAVATPIAIATGVGMGKLGGVVTGKVSALNGRVPRFLGRRIAGATTMAVAMPAADWVVTRHPVTFESVWKSAVMGAAVPGGGSHGPAAAAPHADPIRVEPVRDHPMVSADRPPPDPPQLAAEPGAQTAHGTADAPVADAGAGVVQTTGGNAHSAGVESRADAGAVGGVHTTQPASGVGTAEASARSGSRTETTTTKTTAVEHHTRTTAPEKTVVPEKAAPSDKPPSGPEKSVVPDKPAEIGKSGAVEKKENVPQVANRRAETPAGEGAPHADQPASAQPHAGEHPRQEATPEVRDWTGRREHQDEVHRRDAEAVKARDEHQAAVENRKNAPSTEHAERAADQSGKELKDAEKALDKHVKKHGDTDPRAHELREQRDHARAKDDTAQHDLLAAKDADAHVQDAKLAADARQVSYLAAKLDYTLSRLSPAEIRQLAEGKLNLVSEVRLTPEEARMLAIHELVHRTPDGWGFAMNWTQIHADLALRSDLLVQMMTGEGKTAVAVLALGMTAAEHPVHFMTSNRSLAAQAHEKFRKVLEPLGYDVVQVDPAVRYGKPRRPTVYVGDVAAFGWSMGRGHRVPGKHVVVDEVDAVAVELATQVYTHSSGAAGEASAKTQAEVMLAKWALDSGKFDKSDFGLTVDGAAPKLTEAGRQRLADLIGVEPTSRRFATHVTRLEHAAQARWVLKPGRDYIRAVIEGNETILIVSKHSGEPLVDRQTLLEQRWTGVAQALEARHGLDLRADAKHTNAVRTKDLLETYDHLSGMSGTAKDAGQAIRDLYGADKIGRVVEIESFNTRKLEFRPPQHFATAEEKYRAIVDQAIADLSKDGDPSAGRPQAIVVEHNDEVALVTRLVEQRLAEHELAGGIEIQQVNAETMAKFIAEHTFDTRMDAIWKQAGKPGTITIGNKVLGRGIDIEIHRDAFDLGHRPGATDHVFTVKGDGREAVGGGLAVRVGFHDVESPRGTVQALNRAGRQGAPGEASLYASHQDELFRRHSSALEAAVAYHDAPSTTAHNEALRNYTEAAVAHARGEGSPATLKAAHEALQKAEQSLAVGNYSAAVKASQLTTQHTNLADIRVQHTVVPERPPAPDNSSGTTPDRDDSSGATPGADDTSRSRRGREQPDALVPDMLRTTPSYQGLSATDQLRVVDAIKQVTGNDPALIEGLRPLLESPGLRALEPADLLAEVGGWHRYNDLFGRAVELDARITGSPEIVNVEHWSSHTWIDAADLGEVQPGERLSTSGRRGQIVNLDAHAGVYSIARDGAEWIVKLFPDKADAQQRKDIADEFAGVVAAAGTGYGPTPYGLVTATIAGKQYVGLAMGRVQGAMVHDPQPSEPTAIAEVGRARRAVTFDTVLQLHQYLRRLLDGGHHSHGELQPLIDPMTGNLRVIDLADVLPLLDDPDYQRLARADHGLGMESMDIRDQLIKAAIDNAHQDADRARLLAAPTDGMNAGAVREAVDAVRRQMRLPDGIELDVVVEADGATLAREHGIPASTGPRPGFFRMEDGRGVIYLSAADHSSPADVSASVWHEIVGHYGWTLFSPEERAQILAAVHQLRRLDAELSAEIDELYADLPADVRDEEFLARLAEGGIPSRLTQAWNSVLSTVFGAALHRIGAISNETLQLARHSHELAPLYKILRTLLQAIRTSRPVHDAGARSRTGRAGPNISRIRPASQNRYDGGGLAPFSAGLVETSYDDLLNGTPDEQALAAVVPAHPDGKVKRFLVTAVDDSHFEIEGARLTPHHLAVMTDLYRHVSIALDLPAAASPHLAQKLANIMGLDITVRTADGWQVLHPKADASLQREGTVAFGPDDTLVLRTPENPDGVVIEDLEPHLGRLLGIGGSKAAFAFYDQVVLIAHPTIEVSFFKQLGRTRDLLTKPGADQVIAPLRYTTVFERDAFVAGRFPTISRDIWATVPDFSGPQVLRPTQASLDSLLAIRAFFLANNLVITDLQFGIDADGRFWAYDVGRIRPLPTELPAAPAGVNLDIFTRGRTDPLEIIDAWIAWAADGVPNRTFTPTGHVRNAPAAREDLQQPSYDWATAIPDHPSAKLHPDTPGARDRAVAELEQAYAAARTGYGPIPVGLVTTEVDGSRYVGVAVEDVDSAVHTDAVTLDTVLQLHDYVRRLRALGHRPADLHLAVDERGNVHVIGSSEREALPVELLSDQLLRAAIDNVKRTTGDGTARDRRVWAVGNARRRPADGADRAGEPGRIDRSEFRGDGRRMPDRAAIHAAARAAALQVAAAVAAARGEARDVAIGEEQITVTLAGGQRLTVKLDVSGIFSGGPVRWERTTDGARIQLSPRAGDEVVGRAVAHAVAGVLSAYRGESEVDQVRAGRRAEVGYLVDRLERGESPYRSRRELGHVLRQLNKIEGRRFGVPPLPRGLRQRVRTVLPRNTIRAWLAEEIDRREDQLTEPPSSRPTRLPSLERRPAGQSLRTTHAPDPAVDRFVHRLFQHFADQPIAEVGLSESQQAVLRELPLFRQFVNWHGPDLAAAFGRMTADAFAEQIAAADRQSVADAFVTLRSLLDQRDNGHSWFQRSTAARQFAELADALGVVAHDNLRAALPQDLAAAVTSLKPGLAQRIDNGVRTLPTVPADLSFRFLQTVPSGAVSAVVLAGKGQIGLAAAVLTGAVLAWPIRTFVTRYREARRPIKTRVWRGAITKAGIGVASRTAHGIHLGSSYLGIAGAVGAVQPVSLYARYLRHRMRVRADVTEQRIAAELDQNRATPAELKMRLADLDTERQRLLQRYDAGVPTELHQLTDVLVRISATFTQYADAMQRAGLDPHTTPDGPEGRPVSASVLHNDPIHARNLTDLTWAPGRHHEPSVDAENAALIAAKIHQATNGRYGPFTLAQIQSHATTGRGLLDIAADIVFAEEHRRTPSRALAARVDFHRSLTADHARAVPASLLQPERPPLDWPTYAKSRPNALQQQQAELTNRAKVRTESAANAKDDPTKARHAAIAAACRAAARQGDLARQAWQEYLDTPTPAMLQAAKKQDALYEQRRAESLPPKDVLQTATVSGQLPHLTALTIELNEALAQQNKTFRITPELLHRTLRAETRRLLSPDGLVLTVGNDPRADVTELTQFELTLNPSELQEVLDSPVLIEEAQLGQLVQGGYNVATTITQAVSASSGFRFAPLLSALPDTNPLKIAALISPSIEYSKNVALSVTGGATEYGLPGAVEVIQGEIHRFRSSHPSWSWRMRTSAAGSWSARHVVAGGTKKDTATLELGISHAYTVGAATETLRIPSDERRTDLPEHVATRVEGLNQLADRAIAGLRQRLGGLDRIGHDQLRGLITEDAPGRLAETTRPGGLTRVITSRGRAVAYARLETVAVWEKATLLGDSSKDHKVERLRVGFSGTSGGETFSAGDSVAVSAGYGGTATQDLGTSSWDLGPSGRAGVNAGHDSSVNTGDTAIHPSVQRMQPTIGVKMRLEHRLTIHRVDQAGEFTLTAAGDAVLRMPENDAYRYGLPVPSEAIVRDQDGQPRYGVDGRRLLRGDPQPTDETILLPIWMQRDFRDGSSQHQEGPRPIRGAGPALVQELSGADEALQEFLEHLSAKGLIPYGELGGKDPALAASQLANLERIGQQLTRHRLETGYDPAAQEGIVLRLDRHRTGLPPEQHTYRIRLRSYTGEARLLGLSTGETVVNLDIGSNTTGRSGGWSRSLPWQAKFGFSDKPGSGAEGSTPEIAPSYGRSSLGRFISWATGSTVNRVSLTESTAPVAVFEVPHSIVITEVGHEAKPIVTVDGTARLSIDSEFCRRDDTEPTLAIKGKVDPVLLRTATFQAVDVGDLVGQLTNELPELARGDSSALHHLSAFLNPRNLAARPELLTAPYRTSLLVTPTPSNVEQTLNQRGVTTGRARLTVDTTLLNLRYVGSGHPVNGEINLTLGSSTLTTGTSTSGTTGLGGGDGAVATDGSSYGGSLSGSRSKDRSASSTETQIGGVERLAIRDGEHYQFWADLGVVAELRAIGAEPRAAVVRSGAVMLTLPEREALRLYGLGKLDLPAAKVDEAVNRLLNGELHLPSRTVLAIARRQSDPVQRERLAATLRETVTVLRMNWWLERIRLHRTGQAGLLDAVMPTAEELIELGTEVQLPEFYKTTMGAGLIDETSLQDPDGHETDLYREVLAAAESSAPEALDDPVLAAGLRGDLAGLRWHGHIDDLLSQSGFVTEYPTGDGRRVTVRIKVEYDGPIRIDGVPDAGGQENAFNIIQAYDYREESRSVTQSTSYNGQVGGALGKVGSGTTGVGTDLGTSTTASSTEQNTRMSRALWNPTKRVSRGYRMTVQVDGAEPRNLTGEMTLLVPASAVNAPMPQAAEPGKVVLPRGTVVEGTIARKLFKTVYSRLGKPDLLTEKGARLHRTALENMLSAATRLAAFERIASPEGHTMVQLPVPGRRSRLVAVQVRAVLSNLQLVAEGDAQLGQIDRQQRITQLTTKSNRLLPASRSVGGSNPTGIQGGLSSGEQVGERSSDSTGNRNETTMNERGPVVTVKVDVGYHLRYEDRRLDRRDGFQVASKDTGYTSGTAYLTMFRREYDALRGKPSTPPLAPAVAEGNLHTAGSIPPPNPSGAA
ncbi:DEAD/DEAH box helicase [Kribbella speibonae]|uniref:SecA family profile domain-containing protein n=1 Tax=Kribbella speibonae TaxID=1572660 RepID=A0A4R0ILT3_9ACTN|nr:DEAD/DEAH box helicase [Kribbella speibonae]TCC29645.1 hypothetical protein E0H92_42275 [Kribbella speibonae]